MNKINSLALSSLTAALLIGCGGGSSGGGNSSSSNSETITPTTPVITTQTLSFIDDKVSGVKYVNGTTTGFTDANGQFPYTSGTVEFYLGDIKLGSLSSIPTDKNVFIQDVVGVDRTDTSNAKVLKIASLLQSLDSNTSTDEIEIKEEDFNKFKNQSITSIDENSDIQTLLTNLNFTKVSDENTKRHLDNSLKYYGVTSDTTAPTLLSSSILNGAINVSIDANIVLSFSDDIRKKFVNSTNIVLKDSNSNVIECDITSNFKTITINPKQDLSYATTYNLTLKSTIEDYGKNSLGTTDTTISFTTQAQPDVNAPTITSASTFSVNENQNSAFTITASDTSAISYSIEGTDKDLFNINSTTGAVTFKSNPDYESSSHTPSYSLIVKATDTSNNSSTQTVSITILNVDETIPDTTPPVITSASTFSALENQNSAFTVTATDDSNTTITYSISGGTDASAFSINPTSGAVTFNTAPDYETKTSYSVTVKATDSSNNFSTKAVTVGITDVVETTGVFKTGQTTSYATGDDGYYASTLGVARSFTRTNEIVTDNITKLQWQDDARASTTTANWTTATTSTCQNLTLGGYSDWRLPTIEELESIVNYGASAPAKYSEFLNMVSSFYWSSTTLASDSSYAWYVLFSYGYDDWWNGKANSYRVRCVRAGQ